MNQHETLDALMRGEIERVNERERQWSRRQRERVRRQERLVWLITGLIFAFIAAALFCGPASAL